MQSEMLCKHQWQEKSTNTILLIDNSIYDSYHENAIIVMI